MTQELPGNKLAGRTAALIESPVILGGSGEVPFQNPGVVNRPVQFQRPLYGELTSALQ